MRIKQPGKNYHLRHWAHAQLSAAVQSKKMVRPRSCEQCGREAKVDGHHADYAAPLDVSWLCRGCHSQLNPGTVRVTAAVRGGASLKFRPLATTDFREVEAATRLYASPLFDACITHREYPV